MAEGSRNGSWRATGTLSGAVALIVMIAAAVSAHVNATRDIQANADRIAAVAEEAREDRMEFKGDIRQIRDSIRAIELNIAALARKESP